MNGLLYLLQLNIYLVLFYGLYLLLLRNETFFKMNRFYLMGSTLLAMTIPLLKAAWIKELFVPEQVYEATQMAGKTLSTVVFKGNAVVAQDNFVELAAATSIQKEAWSIDQVFWIIYGSITALFLLNFLRKLYLVNRAMHSESKFQAFSFFKRVVVDEQLKGNETIMHHEMVHVKQWHSLDVIFLELFAAFNWFNPIAYAFKKAIRNIHEFIADETAAARMPDKSEYALLLVSNAFGTQSLQLTNSFYSQSLLKRRLIMLHKNKSRKVAILKYGFSVPLFAIMVVLSSATIERSVPVQAISSGIQQGIPMVINALSNGAIAVQPAPKVKEEASASAASPTASDEVAVPVNSADSAALEPVRRYFERKISYPAEDQEKRIIGTSHVIFELDAAGTIQNFSVVQAANESFKRQVTEVAKIAAPFGNGLAGKYILGIKYELDQKQGTNMIAEDRYDYSQYPGYQKLQDLRIRGYVALSPKERTADELRKYFAEETKFPLEAYEANIDGHVFIAFEVDDAGNITNPTTIASQSKVLLDETMRVFKSAKQFTGASPGKYIIPMNFSNIDKKSMNAGFSVNLNMHKEYQQLSTVFITGYKEANHPGTVATKGQWQTPAVFNSNYSWSHTAVEVNGTIANYIGVDHLTEPVILLNGKVADYKTTEKGFKLDSSFSTSKLKAKIYTGDEAVKNFNESVRTKGLIVLTTE